MANKNKRTNLIEDFDKLVETATKNLPKWMEEFRSCHANRIVQDGFPTVKDEEWRYTNVSTITDNTYCLDGLEEVIGLGGFGKYINDEEINIVFVNGQLSENLSNIQKLCKNVHFSTLSSEVNASKEVGKLLLQFDDYPSNSFVSVNNTFYKEGVYLRVEKGTISKDLIHVIHITTSKENKTLNVPRTLLHLEESCEITVIESHLSLNQESTYLSAPVTDIYLSENSTLHYCKAQDESKSAYHIGQTRVWIERNADFDGFSFMTGAKLTRNNLDIVINGEGANANLNSLYSSTDAQHVDNHTSVDHRVPNCTSNQLYKGILNNSSRAVFNGKVFVKPVAQQTNSYQINKNLLLGDKCRVDTKPQLEIFADDVKCTHGATIGQLEEDELFYLQTRNISRKRAVEMLARGFADDVLNTIQNVHIQDKLHILLEPSFTAK